MKKIKKLLAMLMAMTMMLGMSVTVFATEETPPKNPSHTTAVATRTASDTGTITVKGITDETEGMEVWAFQIIKAKYEAEESKFSGYEVLYNTDHLTLNDKGEVVQKGTELEQALATIENGFKYTDTKAEDGTVTTTWNNVSNNASSLNDKSYGAFKLTKSTDGYSETVPVGSYLVVIKGAESKAYNPIVVSVSYVNVGASVESSTLNIANGEAWVKENDGPTITKEAQGPRTGQGEDAHSVNIGEAVAYTVTVPSIPEYTGTYPKFSVVDTLGTGLEFKSTPDQVKVYTTVAGQDPVELTPSANYYTATIEDNVLTVDFVVSGKGTNGYTLNDKKGQTLTIKYEATVTTAAGMNSTGNANSVVLKYSKDSNINADPGTTPPSETKTYTFDLSLTANGATETAGNSFVTKTGEIKGTDGTITTSPLGGAVFTLYKNEDCTEQYSNTAFNGVVTSSTTTGKVGELVIKGLAAGEYYLKETTPPAGYSLNDNVYKIILTATYDSVDEDKLTGWTIDISYKKAGATGDYTSAGTATTVDAGSRFTFSGLQGGKEQVEIPNTQLASLPSTGGIGTTIFTIGGCALMIIAAALYFATRRKTAK